VNPCRDSANVTGTVLWNDSDKGTNQRAQNISMDCKVEMYMYSSSCELKNGLYSLNHAH
jgi:hypothetical protein